MEEELTGGFFAVSSDTSAKIYSDSSKSKCIVEYSAKEYKGRTDRPRGVITIHDIKKYDESKEIFETYLSRFYDAPYSKAPIRRYSERSRRGSLRKKRKQKRRKKTKRKKHKKKRSKKKKTKRKSKKR